jgi:hypothetical protein
MIGFQAMVMLCSTLLMCTGAMLAVFLYAIERGVFQVTVQVAAAPAPQIVLRQSARQVFR